ncbi:MAG: DNA polymerase III subunit gamma/tau [Phycisphaerales bacterium]|nr:DNA polymerase III subunit gamma/tau [Phycisphaerales bacterium]
MAYTVLARRYRSQDFDEVIGQEAIARTLSRAIESDRVAHAYLFTGTRGVGKTSMARIFAKALNVTPELTDAEAIGKAIMQGGDIDVIEIDGASNRGVDEARDLIANSIYRPNRCPYKIYIIDEVHMLTREAFNALLKTMEEPPSHVKFILCTTEPHKVPATIQSRCQRFDFRMIPTKRIAEHLRAVLKSEKVKADERLVLQVARLGHGSMRDALSLLDRLLSEGEKTITVEMLAETLGLPDQALVHQFVEAVADGQPAAALDQMNEMLNRGVSPDQFIEIVIDRLRLLMLACACGVESELLELADDEREEIAAQAGRFDAPGLVYMIALLENVQRSIKSSVTGRALLDAAVVRLALSEKFADAAALLKGSPAGDGRLSGAGSAGATQKKSPQRAEPPPKLSELAAATAARSAASPVPSEPEAPPPTAARVDVDPEQVWRQVVEEAHGNARLGPVVDALSWDQRLDGPSISLTLNDGSLLAYARTCLGAIEKIFASALGRPVRIELIASAAAAANGHGPGPALPSSSQFAQAAQIPIVRKAMELLDARIVDVKPAPRKSK